MFRLSNNNLNCAKLYIYIYILYVYINRIQFKKFTIFLRYSDRKGVHILSHFDKISCFAPNHLNSMDNT